MSRPVIRFPDAVLIAIDYLRTALPGTTVLPSVPDDRPSEFITVRRIGGQLRGILDRPRIDVRCWSQDEAGAESLMERARAYSLAMAGSHGGTTVADVREVSGPMDLPDSISGQPTYAFAFEFCTRGTPLE